MKNKRKHKKNIKGWVFYHSYERGSQKLIIYFKLSTKQDLYH